MANPSGTHQEPTQPSHAASSSFNGNPIYGQSVPVPVPVPELENSVAAPTLKHNPGLSTEWTTEEQSILGEGLTKYASDSSIIRYAKIAIQLQNKTIRDVAFRCRWMSKKENSKKRKDEHNLARKSKDKKEKVTDPFAKSSQLSARPGFSPYIQQMITTDNDDGVSFHAIGGDTGQLLEQNTHAFEQISKNFNSHQIHDNISLFCQARDNILNLLNNLSEVPEIMKHMPPLPVRMNEELANSILPRTTVPMQS